jgi:hypothetical protein
MHTTDNLLGSVRNQKKPIGPDRGRLRFDGQIHLSDSEETHTPTR